MKKIMILFPLLMAPLLVKSQFKILDGQQVQFLSNVANWGRAFTTYVSNPQACAYHLNYNNADRFYVSAQGWLWTRQGSYIGSDESLKDNVTPISDALNLISQLQGVSYNYTEEPGRERMGFIAQDMENVFPGLVRESQYDGLLGVSYHDIIALLLEGIKEMQSQMETMESVMYSQELDIVSMKNRLSTSGGGAAAGSGSLQLAMPVLCDNTPNPFDVDTEIQYFLPATYQSASIMIHDMQGGPISSYPLSQSGFGSLLIQGAQMKAGMYLYTLIVDGKIIDSKRMILVE
jgi:hypothetical protein